MPMNAGFLSREDWTKAAIVAAVVALDAIGITLGGGRFEWPSLVRVAGVVLLLLVVAELYRRWRPFPKFVVMTRETAWLLAFSAAGSILSYLAATADLPLVDVHLAAADRALGFDWLGYYAFVTGHPFVGMVAAFLYFLALPLIAFAVIALAAMDRVDRARELVLVVMISALIAIAISALWPASGALAYYRPGDAGLLHRPMVDLGYKQTFFDLREGAIRVFTLDGPKGIIAFPSYHVALSMAVVLAFRGMARFFWPLLALNLAAMATTPVEGGHHLVDGIAGAAVAILSLAVAVAWRRRLSPEPACPAAGRRAALTGAHIS
jgi:hypothetical protein